MVYSVMVSRLAPNRQETTTTEAATGQRMPMKTPCASKSLCVSARMRK